MTESTSTTNTDIVTQYLFNYARSEDTAKTVQEIIAATGVAFPTVHRILNVRNRPRGIRVATERRKTNTKRSMQFWYDVMLIAEATKQYEAAKLTGEVIQMPIPNNSTQITPRDLVPLYLPKEYIDRFENAMTEEFTANNYSAFSHQLADLIRRLDEADLPEDAKWRNVINIGLAMAQKGIAINEID